MLGWELDFFYGTMFTGGFGMLFFWVWAIDCGALFYICPNGSKSGLDDVLLKFSGLLKTAIKFSFCICLTNSSFGFLGFGFCKLAETELNCSFGLSWVCWMGFWIFCTGFGSYFFAGTLIPIISKKSKSVEFSATYCFGCTWGMFELKLAQSSLVDCCFVGLGIYAAIWKELNSSAEVLLSWMNLLTIWINRNIRLAVRRESMNQCRRCLCSFSKSP